MNATPPRHRYLELFILMVVVISIVLHFIEVESPELHQTMKFFFWAEAVIAAIFTVEYIARWLASRSWWYPFQPMAIVDLAAVLPFYFSFLVDLRSLRLLRTLRVLRMFKLGRHSHALQNLFNAFNRVRYEFSIIGFAAFVVVWCSSLAIFGLEQEAQPEKFGKFSDAVWFVLVTVTTVGYGDKVPITAAGKVVASITMVSGLAMFGTFISLVGSAFLEEIRHNIHPQTPANPSPPDGAASAPEWLRSMTPDRFDPVQVLKAIDTGVLHGTEGTVQGETVRLLSVACRNMIGEGNLEKPE